jgi:hypothetical protein
MSVILFVLGLLLLHWREKDEHARTAEPPAEQPAPAPTPVPAKV